jgi:excisionase family DNA binding protein
MAKEPSIANINILPHVAETDRLLRPEEAAERLACGKGYVYTLIRRGAIPAVNVGRLIRIRESDLNAFVAGMQPIAPTVARF